MFEKTLESPLDRKETQPVHAERDQFWVFIGKTSIEVETAVLWPPDARSVISRLRRFPGEQNSDSLQYFCLEKPQSMGTTKVRYNLATKSPLRKHRLSLQLLLGYRGRARTQSPETIGYTVGFPLFEGHTRTAMGEPRPGRTTFLVMVSPLPGK